MRFARPPFLSLLLGFLSLSVLPAFSLRHAISEDVLLSDEAPLLEVFQVYPPALHPHELEGATVCSYELMQHTFGNSAGKPFVGTYRPLCGDNWDVAILNLSMISFGRQYDRLGSVWIGNTEVWRTCTAEPVWSGIHFTFSKDISDFRSLLSSPQQLVVDVGNYVFGPYNGSFNATLSINFYNLKAPPSERPPNSIIPLSKVDENGISNYFSLPNDDASASIIIPKNTSRLALEVFASGNGQEEFWYSNVPNEYSHTFAPWNATFLAQGPFREVVVYIDDLPVGVLWPFEVVFTGGICPGFWRPIVGHRTFDLPSYAFDLTPYIPYLRGGKHTIQFKVRGQPHTLQNWYVSGHLRLWTSSADTTSLVHEPVPIKGISSKANITITGNVASDNSSFSVSTFAERQEEAYSLIYQNRQSYELSENGSVLKSNLSQTTIFSTPLFQGYYIFNLDSVERDNEDGTIDLNATLSQTFHRITNNVFNTSIVEEHAEVYSVGYIHIGKKRNLGQGNTSVSLHFKSPRRMYSRDVRATGFKIIMDEETDVLVEWSEDSGGQLQFQVPN